MRRQLRELTDRALQCRVTLAPSLVPSEPANRLCAYIWTHQYRVLSPSTCWVLDDGQGTAVGYCIGCPDIDDFCARYDTYVTEILDPSPDITRPDDLTNRAPWIDPATGQVNETALAQQAYNPRWLNVEGNEDVINAGYRATMHIDILPEWQGKGWGRKLIDALFDSVRAHPVEGRKGLWLGIAGDNAKVVEFYERMGLRVWPQDGWKPGDGIKMVKDL